MAIASAERAGRGYLEASGKNTPELRQATRRAEAYLQELSHAAQQVAGEAQTRLAELTGQKTSQWRAASPGAGAAAGGDELLKLLSGFKAQASELEAQGRKELAATIGEGIAQWTRNAQAELAEWQFDPPKTLDEWMDLAVAVQTDQGQDLQKILRNAVAWAKRRLVIIRLEKEEAEREGKAMARKIEADPPTEAQRASLIALAKSEPFTGLLEKELCKGMPREQWQRDVKKHLQAKYGMMHKRGVGYYLPEQVKRELRAALSLCAKALRR